VVAAGAPNLPIGDIFPLIAMFAVANSALINMMMASRLLYGMAKQRVLPPVLGRYWRAGVRRGWRSCSPRRSPWDCCLVALSNATANWPARRHHGAAAARGVHRRQHLLPGAARIPSRASTSAPRP
jgi:hypothetical protein